MRPLPIDYCSPPDHDLVHLSLCSNDGGHRWVVPGMVLCITMGLLSTRIGIWKWNGVVRLSSTVCRWPFVCSSYTRTVTQRLVFHALRSHCHLWLLFVEHSVEWRCGFWPFVGWNKVWLGGCQLSSSFVLLWMNVEEAGDRLTRFKFSKISMRSTEYLWSNW